MSTYQSGQNMLMHIEVCTLPTNKWSSFAKQKNKQIAFTCIPISRFILFSQNFDVNLILRACTDSPTCFYFSARCLRKQIVNDLNCLDKFLYYTLFFDFLSLFLLCISYLALVGT